MWGILWDRPGEVGMAIIWLRIACSCHFHSVLHLCLGWFNQELFACPCGVPYRVIGAFPLQHFLRLPNHPMELYDSRTTYQVLCQIYTRGYQVCMYCTSNPQPLQFGIDPRGLSSLHKAPHTLPHVLPFINSGIHPPRQHFSRSLGPQASLHPQPQPFLRHHHSVR